MELIEKIRTEIERRIEESRTRQKNLEDIGQENAGIVEEHIRATLKALLSFLSTLESEKPMNQEELEEEINRTYHDGSVADTSDLDHNSYENIARHFYDLGCRHAADLFDEMEYNRQRAEKQNGEELEKEIYDYCPDSFEGFGFDDAVDLAHHFAKWGAEHLR